MASVGALRPYGLRRRLTWALGRINGSSGRTVCVQYPGEFRLAPHAITKQAVCPTAACSPNSFAEVPHAIALLGCPSTGGHRTGQQRPSASRPRLAGRPSFGGQRQVLCRGKPQHKQPTVAAAPPPLGGSGRLSYS